MAGLGCQQAAPGLSGALVLRCGRVCLLFMRPRALPQRRGGGGGLAGGRGKPHPVGRPGPAGTGTGSSPNIRGVVAPGLTGMFVTLLWGLGSVPLQGSAPLMWLYLWLYQVSCLPLLCLNPRGRSNSQLGYGKGSAGSPGAAYSGPCVFLGEAEPCAVPLYGVRCLAAPAYAQGEAEETAALCSCSQKKVCPCPRAGIWGLFHRSVSSLGCTAASLQQGS